MLGKPKYHYGETVKFLSGDDLKTGEIEIIDPYGTFYQSDEPSYDVMIKEENCLYKHIRESNIDKVNDWLYGGITNDKRENYIYR